MLTSKQRAALRAKANTLEVVFQVGKGEIDEALVKTTADCLAARELIKMKVLETSAYSAKEAAEQLAAATDSEVVQVIGGRFVLFKRKPKDSAFTEVLTGAKPKPAAKPAAKSAAKSAARPHAKTDGKYGEKPAARYGEKPASKFGERSTEKFGERPAAKFGAKPAAKFGARPAGRAAGRPTGRPSGRAGKK